MAIHASRQEQLAKRLPPSATCRNRNRRLLLERLENRELLAVLASDGFDSGSFTGGTGWNAASWSVSGSGALVQSTNTPHSGSHHALLRNNAGQIQRAVNVAGLSEVKLQFWAKINSFESGDQGLVQISSSGTSWTTIHTFTSAHSNNQYQFYNLTIPVTGSTLHVRFDAAMDQANDQWFLDDVQVVHTPPLPAGLVAWWTGNGTTSDETGNHNATLVNGATYAAGQVGQAFKLDGVNDRVQVADSPSLALTQSLSIEAWIKADGLPSEQGEIFFRGDDRGGLDPYSLSLQPNGQLRWQVVSGPDAAEVWSPIPLGQFVHVAATLDDATGQLSLYLNGVLASQTVTSVRPFGALSPTSNPGIGIGNHGGSPATPHNFPFKGLIDELKVHNSALSLAQVQASFLAGGGLPSVAIGDAAVVEGDAATFTVSLNMPASGTVTVNYATAGGTATSGSDFLAGGGVVTFAPGETSKTIVVPTIDDTLEEGAETFSVNLSSPVGAKIADSQGVATIQPSDQRPVVSIGDATANENDLAFVGAPLVPADGSGLAAAGALLVGPDGNTYVASHDTDSVKVFADSGAYLGELITPGGELDGPWGMAFGPDGKLYVGGRSSRNIIRFNIATGDGEVAVESAMGNLGQPMSLAFGSDGTLFATSRLVGDPPTSHPVKRFDVATGEFLGDFVTPGSEGLVNANGIAFGPDGNLYVGSAGSAEIKRFDGETGAFLDNFVPTGSGGLTNVSQFVFHTDGRLYVGSQQNQRILRYDGVTGAFEDIYVAGLGASPFGFAFAASGELYVSLNKGLNNPGSSVARVTTAGVPVALTLSFPSAVPVTVNYATANGTATAGSDYLAASGTVTFPAGTTTQTIYVRPLDDSALESNETLTVTLSSPSGATIGDGQATVTILDDDAAAAVSISDATFVEGSSTAHYRRPFAQGVAGNHFNVLTFGPGGYLYASLGGGPGANTIRRYDAVTGAFVDTLVNGGIADTRDMVFRDGFLYVGSENSDEVLRYNATTGEFVDAFVPAGSGGLDGPHGLTFGPDANGDGIPELYVSGRSSFNVVRYDGATGAPLGEYVASGSGGLSWPEGLTFDPSGNFLFVASKGSGQVLKYNAHTGTFLGVGASANLNGPKDVKFGPDGLMYVTSGNNDRIPRFTAAGVYVDDYVPAGSGGMRDPSRMAFGPDGNLYVTSTGNDHILRFGTQSELVFTVSRPSALPTAVTVDFATASGTATSGSDFAAVSGSITLAAGVRQATIRVPLLDDSVYEGNETFTVNLSNPVGGVILDGQGVGTIVDNDQQPTKFYVVDDATANKTFEYGPTGAAVENYNLNSGNAAPRGAASTAAGDKVWVIDANKTVYVYNAAGGLLGSWTAGTLASNAQPEGIATNGTDIWIVDAKSDTVLRYTGAASRTSGSQNAASSFNLASGNGTPTDIVTDGASFWVLNAAANDKVFKYTLAGAALGNWTLSTSGAADPTGITLDPASPSHLWIVDSGTDRVYQYDGAVTRTSGSQAASASFALAAGNANPQGIADPPVSGEWSSDSAWLAAGPESIAAEVAAAWSGTRRRTDAIVADAAPLRLRQKEIVQPARLIVKDEPGLHHAGNNDEPEYRRRESNDSEASDEALLEVLDEWEIVRRG